MFKVRKALPLAKLSLMKSKDQLWLAACGCSSGLGFLVGNRFAATLDVAVADGWGNVPFIEYLRATILRRIPPQDGVGDSKDAISVEHPATPPSCCIAASSSHSSTSIDR